MEWDGTDGRNVGAQQTVWEIVMHVERCDGKAKEGEQGAVCFGSGLGRRLSRESVSLGMRVGDALQFPVEDLAGVVRLFRAPEASAV